MKILVLNCGSSSIKYKLYDMSDKSVLAAGGVEKIGLPGSFLKVKFNDGSSKKIEQDMPTHEEGIALVFKVLTDPEIGVIRSLDEINAVGHRIAHGGIFTKSVRLTQDFLDAWKKYMDLAPLHSYGHLMGINAVKKALPNVPQACVFDTAFHQTMPDYAYMYAIPYEFYEKYGVRRYGFHGTSYRFVKQRVGEILGINADEKKIVACHIGNGASMCAIDHGKCIDTTMGLTPLEGLMMGSRSGDIDSYAILFLMEKLHINTEQASDLLNKQSGLLGVSGVSSDVREVEDAVATGNPRAQLAMKMYDYRIKKYIGAYAAAMGGVDIIIFTAGVGEHQADVREGALEGLGFLGVELDKEKNNACNGDEAIVSTPNSKVVVAVIPTDEEVLVASDTLDLVK